MTELSNLNEAIRILQRNSQWFFGEDRREVCRWIHMWPGKNRKYKYQFPVDTIDWKEYEELEIIAWIRPEPLHWKRSHLKR